MPDSHPAYRLGRATSRAMFLGRWWRSIDDRDALIAAWRAHWWYEIKEHVVIEVMVTTGSALGAAILTGDFWGRAALGAVVGGFGAIVILVLGQAIRACFYILRSIRHVNARAKDRMTGLIRNGHFYLEHPGLNPHHSRPMYEQHHRQAAPFASEVDSFLNRYYPQSQTTSMLAREFVNLHMPSFDDLPERTAHIDKLNCIIRRGLEALAGVKRSGKRPKPSPFHIVG